MTRRKKRFYKAKERKDTFENIALLSMMAMFIIEGSITISMICLSVFIISIVAIKYYENKMWEIKHDVSRSRNRK